MSTPQIVKLITVRHSFNALHRWVEAPPEVSFLRNAHRHEFTVCLTVEVTHGDRQVEFFILQKFLATCVRRLFGTQGLHTVGKDDSPELNLGLPIVYHSCEDMAEAVLLDFERMGYKVSAVSVSEDGENEGIALRR